MESILSAHIAYFSGTGCTARVAGHLARALTQRGALVSETEITAGAAAAFGADWLIVLFPVYAANAPQPVGEWVAAAPDGLGRRAAVISVSGGGEVSPNTACRVATVRALEKKGYRVQYEAMAVMPANFLMPYGDTLSALLLRKAATFADLVARDLLAGRARRPRTLPLDRLLARLFRVEHLGSGLFGRHLRADARCTGCSRCAARCPRGNIRMANGRPTFGGRCVLCLRCVYGCPARAIVPGFGQFAILKGGFDLDALEARTAGMDAFPPSAELAGGKAMNGVRRYLDELDAPQPDA